MTIFPNHKRRFALLCVLLVSSFAFSQHTSVTVEDAQTITSQKALSSNNAVLTADFTTANASGFQTITGLGFTLAASTAQNVPFRVRHHVLPGNGSL
jgi:hypothetical protein